MTKGGSHADLEVTDDVSEQIMDEVDRRGWFAMATDWFIPHRHGMAFVAVDDDHIYDVDGATAEEALIAAMRMAEAAHP